MSGNTTCEVCGNEADERIEDVDSVSASDPDTTKCFDGSDVYVHTDTDAGELYDDDVETTTITL